MILMSVEDDKGDDHGRISDSIRFSSTLKSSQRQIISRGTWVLGVLCALNTSPAGSASSPLDLFFFTVMCWSA